MDRSRRRSAQAIYNARFRLQSADSKLKFEMMEEADPAVLTPHETALLQLHRQARSRAAAAKKTAEERRRRRRRARLKEGDQKNTKNQDEGEVADVDSLSGEDGEQEMGDIGIDMDNNDRGEEVSDNVNENKKDDEDEDGER